MSKPTDPKDLSRLDLDGKPLDVAVSPDHAFVASDAAGLHSVNVVDPLRPAATGRLTDTHGYAKGVALSGTNALVAVAQPGANPPPGSEPGALSVVDISDPSDMKELGRVRLSEPAGDIVVTGDYAIVADRYGVTLVDVSDPNEPAWLDRFVPSDLDPDLIPQAVSVDAKGSLVYVAVDPASLFVLELVEGPIPTPSVPPTALPTATEAPTLTPTITSTPSATETNTPTPRRAIYLPIAERD
jgi:hypothetical protein